MNTTDGRLITLTTFGESHGPALGGVIDGFPAGMTIDIESLKRYAARRRPGQSAVTTSRSEVDEVHFLSGVSDKMVTTGAPLAFMIHNTAQRSADYDEIARMFRPNHADYTYFIRYSGNADIRGGGRSSARETVSRVVAGGLASQYLHSHGISIHAFTRSVGEISLATPAADIDFDAIESNTVRCPDALIAQAMERLILDVKANGDTIGGIVECVVTGVPAGLGSPVFDKLTARLAGAMMSINAAKGFESGMGFEGTRHRGSEVIDHWIKDESDVRGIRTSANNSGGIQGGISNGENIVFRVAFKPVATLLRNVETVSTELQPAVLKAKGRHDPCVVPRAVPIVEAMTALVLMDEYLIARAYGIV